MEVNFGSDEAGEESSETTYTKADLEREISKVRSAEQKAKAKEVQREVERQVASLRAEFDTRIDGVQTKREADQVTSAFQKKREQRKAAILEAFGKEENQWGPKLSVIFDELYEDAIEEAIERFKPQMAPVQQKVQSVEHDRQMREFLQGIATEFGFAINDPEFLEVMQTETNMILVGRKLESIQRRRSQEEEPNAGNPLFERSNSAGQKQPNFDKLLAAARDRRTSPEQLSKLHKQEMAKQIPMVR